MREDFSIDQKRIARRRFIGGGLAALAVAGTGIGLAACGDDDDNSAIATGTTTPVPIGLAPGPRPSGKIEVAHDATLPPLEASPRKLTYRVTDETVEIAAGVQYNSWTFEGTVPGPVLHVKQGDKIEFTLQNDGAQGHSIDFHSARTPWDKNYVTIPSGETLSFDWTADFPGVFMYHCGTPFVLHHIANGMYGTVVVEPETPFEPAQEYVLVQSEFYASEGTNGVWEADVDKMLAVRPDLVTFNGAAYQYRDNPLQAKVGEKIRLHVMNAGPTLFSAFHIIGALFDVVYVDGNPRNPLYGLQTYTIPPGGGATFELVIPEAGLYPFVTHSFAYTDLGAIGLLEVTE